MGVGSSENVVALDLGVHDLADDVFVGETDNHSVLGRVVLVLGLNNQPLASIVVSLALYLTQNIVSNECVKTVKTDTRSLLLAKVALSDRGERISSTFKWVVSPLSVELCFCSNHPGRQRSRRSTRSEPSSSFGRNNTIPLLLRYLTW